MTPPVRPTSILIYTHEYPPFMGGAGIYTFDLANAMAFHGTSIKVISPAYPEELTWMDEGSVSVSRYNELARFTGKRQYIFASTYLKKSYDIVLITDFGAQLALADMPSPFFPYCIVVYGTEIWNYFEPNKGTNLSKDYEKYRRFFLSAEMLFAISKGTADLLISYLPEVTPKVYVVNCGVNLNRLKDPSPVQKEKIHKELKIESSNVILCVARFGKDKGQDVLSRAFKLVLNTFPNTVLIFVGEGPKRSDIESLVERLSISQNIRFVGNVSGEDLPVYYDICDIFAMPSRCVERWEGFGIVFLEANYRKKPVIAGDAGGVPDAVKDGFNGFLVDPMDHEAIATKIIDLLKHPELRQRLGENGYLRVVNEKNSNNEASKMLDKLNEIVSQYKSDSLINLLAKKIGALKWLLTGLARWSISSFNQTLHSILNYLFK